MTKSLKRGVAVPARNEEQSLPVVLEAFQKFGIGDVAHAQHAKSLPLISVIIPAFNEEQTVGPLIKDIGEILRMLDEGYELIVVDDGSTDKTAEVASENGARAHVISNCQNLGKGFALMKGFEKAGGAIIVTMDADGAHKPEEIPRLLYPLFEGNGVDVVIGSRFEGDIEENAIPPLKSVGNKFFNLILSILLRHRITDSQSGFRAYRRSVLEKVAIDSKGFEIETEMILKVLKKNFRIKEVPITCRSRNGSLSKLHSFKDGFKILKTIFRFSLTN